jgi:tetratricopeptide (TPR) repeat protein
LQNVVSKEKPLDSVEKLSSVNAQKAQTLYDRGNALKAMGRLSAAIASWSKAIELEPKFYRTQTRRSKSLLSKSLHLPPRKSSRRSHKQPRSLSNHHQQGDRKLIKGDRTQSEEISETLPE